MSSARPCTVVVLAAGEGTRMRSSTPKVLHTVAGRSLLGHAVLAARGLRPERLAVVVRHERDRVAAHVGELDADAVVADQDAIKGTGRAVACGLEELERTGGPVAGEVVVTYGDVPLLTADTLRDLLATHVRDANAVTVLTAHLPDPAGYGRVLREEGASHDDALVLGIVEHRDATTEQRAITEVNSGIYVFDAAVLREALANVGSDNDQGEVYLTDVLGIARAGGGRVAAMVTDDLWQTEGVNDRVQLATLGAELNRRIVTDWMRAGVTVRDPASTWIEAQVELSPDVELLPGTHLRGATRVGRGAVVGPDTTLDSVMVGAGASVVRSHAADATIGAGATVGPFSYLRPGTVLGDGGKIGAYVETKNATIGAGSKVPHLSYVGDATIGEGANIGAATVFVNYDGVAKHRTTVGDHARVGSDSMLIAPVTIGDGAYTAAGSVITADVPPGAMAVARGRQRNVEGWVQRRRSGSPAAAAAEHAAATAPDTPPRSSHQPSGESDPPVPPVPPVSPPQEGSTR